MGTPSSKSRRKNKEFKINKKKQQRALDVVSSINQWNEEPDGERSPPQPPVVQPKPQPKIEISKNIDINSLPRQNVGSEQIIRAIDDVNKRLSKSIENKTKSNDNTDQEIGNFVRKIKQKVNKSETNQINKTDLSHIYSKLSNISPNSLCTNNLSLNQKQRELVIKDLRDLAKSDKKQTNSLTNEHLSLLKQTKFDSDSGISNADDLVKARSDLTRIKPVPGLEDTYSKSYCAIRQLDDLFDDECSEPIYDKPNDLKQIDIRPDVDVLKVDKNCKTIHDIYKVDSDEIRQIIEFIEQKDAENGEKMAGCSYYMKGDEIYSSKHEPETKKKTAHFNAPKIESNKVSNEKLDEKNKKVVRQILNDMVLNYALENNEKETEKKSVHFSSNSCFKPIKSDSKNFSQSTKKKSDDTMPNVTMFIESLDKQNRN